MIQLIYVSAETTPFTSKQLRDLLTQSRAANQSRGLTGMLLYHQRTFMQLLEGEPLDVLNLYRRLEQDPRHTDIRLLLRQSISERTFPDWSMGFAKPADCPHVDLDGLNHVFADSFSGQMFASQGKLAKKLLLQFREGEIAAGR